MTTKMRFKMNFIVSSTGNNFGDKFVSIKNIKTGELIELDAVEGEHSHLDYMMRKLKVVRLSREDRAALVVCIEMLHVISCNPIDVKLLKSELQNDFSPKIIKLARELSKLDRQQQDQILKFI